MDSTIFPRDRDRQAPPIDLELDDDVVTKDEGEAQVSQEPMPLFPDGLRQAEGKSMPSRFIERPHVPYPQLLWGNFTQKTERRKILAFVAAATFLLYSFWNSIEQKQIQKDLKHAQILETFSSGSISQGPQHNSGSRQIVVLSIQISKDGRAIARAEMPEEISHELKQIRFDPPTRNGSALSIKVPIALEEP